MNPEGYRIEYDGLRLWRVIRALDDKIVRYCVDEREARMWVARLNHHDAIELRIADAFTPPDPFSRKV